MKFEHFLLTHFNVKFKWSKKGKQPSSQKPPDKEWMKHRIKLFDKFCYPSIVNQVNKNFKWLIFFDGETTDKKLFKKYDKCIKIFLEDYDIWSYKIASKEIRKMLHKETEWLLTTRFDCDDSLNKKHIETIQQRFFEQEMLLNPTLGITYDINNKIARNFRYVCANSFLTIVEKCKKETLKTCFYVNHPQMRDHFKLIQVETKFPLWLQTVHDRNLGNTMRGKVIKDTSKTMRDFNVNHP